MNKEFEAGQVWTYKHRDNEKKSLLTVLYVEEYENYGIVIHISINNIIIKNLITNEIIADEIQHLPITKKALAKSVIALKHTNVFLPDFSGEYKYWKDAFINNEAGVWDIEVRKTIDYTEKTVNIDH